MRLALAVAALAFTACGSPDREPERAIEPVPAPEPTTAAPDRDPVPTTVAQPAPDRDLDPNVLRAAATSSPPTLDGVLDDPAWTTASAIAITTDYTGAPIASPTTEVRILWSPEALYVAFDCAFDPPLTAPDAPPLPEYEHLYGYDVVEAFLDADPSTPHSYREIELGPRGHTLDVAVDLDARPHGDTAWSSGTTHGERVDDERHRFTIEARIPASALDLPALAAGDLRVGLFRITSHSPSPRLFLARFPTMTPRPNFHVPERFGVLRLVP